MTEDNKKALIEVFSDLDLSLKARRTIMEKFEEIIEKESDIAYHDGFFNGSVYGSDDE